MPVELSRSAAWREHIAGADAAPATPQCAELTFERLYRDHYTLIAAYLYRRTASVHVAEDLAAETFLSALRSMHRPRATGVLPHFWLLRIATNAASRWARDERRRLRRERSRGIARPDSDGAISGAANSGASTPSHTVVKAAVCRLPDCFQSVVALHYFAGLSVAEVALVLECREGTVKSRLSRGRDMLKTLLEQQGEFQ